MRLSSFSFASLAVLLSACSAVGPDYRPPATPAAEAWPTSSAIDSRPVATPIDQDWWALFNDPLLNRLQRDAEANNPDLRAEALRLAQSRALRGISAAGALPTVDARAGAQRQRSSESGVNTRMIDVINPPNRDPLIDQLSEPFSLYQAGFDAAWELDLWGRVRRTVEAADARLEAAGETQDQLRLLVQAELARDYLELCGLLRQAALARQQVEAGDELLALVTRRVDGGLGTDADVERQRAQLAASRAQQKQLDEQQAQALNRIALLLGEQPGYLRGELQSQAALPALPGELPIGLPVDVMRRRPDVRRSEALLHAATADIGVAMADLYPRISIGATLGVESLQGGDLFDWTSRQWSIGPRLSLPLFDGGRRRATVALNELRQQEAAVNWRRSVLTAWHEIDDALTAYAMEQQRHGELAAARDASRKAWELARARYAGGETDYLAPLDAQRQWLQSERDVAQNEVQIRTQMVALYKAIGGNGAAPN